MPGHGARAFVGQEPAVFTGVLEAAEEAEDEFGIGVLALRGNAAQDFLNDAQLLGFVVNDEIAFITQQVNPLP